jgi:hypothetical protein
VLDFGFAHVPRMAFFVEEDKAFDPVDVGLFRLVTVLPKT